MSVPSMMGSGIRTEGRGEADADVGSMPGLGRTAAAVVLFAPLFQGWREEVATEGVDVSNVTLVVVVSLAAAALTRSPGRWPWIAGGVTVALVASAGPVFGSIFAMMTLVWGALVAMAVGMVPPPARIARGALALPLGVAAVAMASLVVPPRRLIVPFSLTLVAASLVVAVLASPALAARSRSAGESLVALAAPRSRGAWRWWQSMCARVMGWRDRWWEARSAPGGAWVDDRDARRDGLAFPAMAWTAMFVVVSTLRLVAPATQDPSARWFGWATIGRNLREHVFIGHWMKWDAGQYLRIAEHGYQYTPGEYFLAHGDQSPVAWFPGWGLAIRAGMVLFGSAGTSAFALALASGLGATVLLWVWMSDNDVPMRQRRVATVLWVVYPYNFMLYGAGWSDAFVVMLVLGAFVALGRERYVSAGVLAGMALLSRPNAVALPLALAVAITWSWWSAHRSPGDGSARRSIVADRRWITVALAMAGLVGFVAWCWWTYREPMLYWNARSQVYSPIDVLRLDELLKVGFVELVFGRFAEDPWGMANRVACALVVLATLWALPAQQRRFGTFTAWFVGISVAIVWYSADDFVASGRYLMVAFPALVAWSGWLAPRKLLTGSICGVWFVVLLYFTHQYTHTVNLGW